MTKVTASQLKTAQENDISKSTVYSRINKGWHVENAITTPTTKKHIRADRKGGRTVSGQFLTNAQLKTAADNGIIDITLWSRINKGWPVEKAINQPTRKRNSVVNVGQHEMTEVEIVEVIGRIKALNRSDLKDFPITLPKPLKEKAARLGINFEEIEPISVELDLKEG